MLIDNKKNNKVGDVLKSNIQNNSKLSIISSYFTLFGYSQLKKELNKLKNVRILISSNSFKSNLNLLTSTKEELKLKNQLQQEKIAKECYQWLKSKSEIKESKINNSIPFTLYHIKNEDNNDFVIQGTSNFSSVGMGYTNSNTFAMNTGINDYETTKEFLNTFEELWNNPIIVSDIKENILNNLEEIFKDKSPNHLYFYDFV